MQYKVGDKVKIRQDLVAGEIYGADAFVEEMEEYKGKIATITGTTYDCEKYQIDLDCYYWWTDEMLEPLLSPKTKNTKPHRVYISGGITNEPNYKENFKSAEDFLVKLGIDCINPAELNNSIPNLTYDEYMNLDLIFLSMCDTIYLLNGWERSNGAKIELKYALDNDYNVVVQLNGDGECIKIKNLLDLIKDSNTVVLINGEKVNLNDTEKYIYISDIYSYYEDDKYIIDIMC